LAPSLQLHCRTDADRGRNACSTLFIICADPEVLPLMPDSVVKDAVAGYSALAATYTLLVGAATAAAADVATIGGVRASS